MCVCVIWSFELSAELCIDLPYNPKPETRERLLLSQPVVVSTTDSSHHHNSTPRDTEICSRYWLFSGSPWILSSLMASHYNYNILTINNYMNKTNSGMNSYIFESWEHLKSKLIFVLSNSIHRQKCQGFIKSTIQSWVSDILAMS